MAPISPGHTPGPPRKAKKPTATTKLHRFESFTKRISKLKIDPIHRLEQIQPVDEEAGLTHSHFREALDHWTDLNLSRNYTDFAKKANPLSESLPQLLHHADAIFELLAEHIGKKDALSLEPLLRLVAHFAQDLRHKFEKYFSKTITLVAHVAASHDAPDVIEWCFTCLAWIFKFLQRLLVPDLQPLLSIMMPYLAARKAYVVRFAAESLAFLLRKAAVLYPRNETPLAHAVTYLLRNLQESGKDSVHESFKVGLMTLFSDAALGAESGLHASGPHLLSCIVTVMIKESMMGDLEVDVLEGVVINLVHQTSSEGLLPFVQSVREFVSSLSSSTSRAERGLARRLLFLILATRKGSRIQDWKDITEGVLHLTELTKGGVTGNIPSFVESQECLSMIAMTMQYAPMHELLPSIARLLQAATFRTEPNQFYQFSDFFAGLGLERFRSLLLPAFQQYVISHWQEAEADLCLSLHILSKRHATQAQPGSPTPRLISSEWESQIIQELSRASWYTSEPFPVLTDAYLRLVDEFPFPQHESNAQSLRETLHQTLMLELQSDPTSCNLVSRRFILGRVFSTYLRLTSVDESLDRGIWTKVRSLPPDHFQLIPFLSALNSYVARCDLSSSLSGHEAHLFQEHLLENLLSNSVQLKILSLNLLRHLSETQSEPIEAIGLALEVLQTPYNPHNVRQITMLLRKFPQQQKKLPASLRTLIPQFCMGLLSTYHDQTRGSLCAVLGELAKEGDDESSILEIAMKWLQDPGTSTRDSAGEANAEESSQLTPFECSNVRAIEHDTHVISAQYEDPERRLMQLFEDDHQISTVEPPSAGRSIAIQLFKSIPEIAEKRSRLLMPVFLSAQSSPRSDLTVPDSNESTSSRTLSPSINEADWTLRDRKAFIELLAQFKNPRVLYRSEEVYAALLNLLMNGNVELQRLALRAIHTWKDSSLQAHYEALIRLLDDKTFSTELGLLLTSNPDESPIEASQRTYVMDVLLRLLYGQMIGRSGSHGSQEGKRRTILRMILRLPSNEISRFLGLTCKGLANVSILDSGVVQTALLEKDLVPLDQQYGLLRMMHSVMEVLQSKFARLGQAIINPVLYCTVRACHQLNSPDELAERTSVPVMVRNIRKIGLQCLDMMFKYCEDIDWLPYMELVFSEMISPRLSTFAIETAQGVSWLLRIFSTWSQSSKTVQYLSSYDEQLFRRIVECLTTITMKDEVKIFVLDEIVMPVASLADYGTNTSNAATEVLQSNIRTLFDSLAQLLEQRPSKAVLQSALVALPELTPFSRSTSETQVVLESLMKVLNDSNLHVSPKIRGNLLRAVQSLLDLHGPELSETSRYQIWANTSALFNYFKDIPNRMILCNIIRTLAKGQPILIQIADICRDLNSASSDRLAELDIDRQIRAFESINSINTSASTQMPWLPLLNNMLYYSRTAEDFSVRSNAVSCLRQFIVKSCQAKSSELEILIVNTLLPAFKKGISEDSEVVRADFVSLFGLVVLHLAEASELEDLKPLLVHDDDEASFFSNILHIQHHRRLRAIRRLTSEVEHGSIRAANVATFFLPLLEKFVANVDEDSNAQSLKGQTIAAIGCLLLWLDWKQFKTTFRRYMRDMNSKSRSEKDAIKLLGVSADALIKAMDESNKDRNSNPQPQSHLASSLPPSATISAELKAHFIPQLTTFVHLKDESQISLRLPAAVTVVKLIKILPEENMAQLIPPLLLDTSQILRSRTQETRDAARNVLAEILVLLGPSSFHFLLKELRATLNRGYQLHVVSYTVHSILVATTPNLATGALDYCLVDLVAVVMDDIFGAVGQEKESQDYISSMKEVKSSKSFDSMELLAKCAGVTALSKLLRPLQALLEGNLNTKQAHQVDELLRRTGMGLSRNEAASSRDLLTFSYELIQDFYRQRTGDPVRTSTTDEKNRRRYLVQPAFASKSGGGISSPLLYKIARFALDIVRSTFQKHATLLTAQNVHGFLPVIGDVLIEAQEDVKTSAMRLLSAVIKLPMSELDESAELYIAEAVKIVRSSISTNNESSQAALKLIAAILRERRAVEVRNTDLAYLLHRILPDLEQPDRQGVTFNFVKAVMARKIALPEVYELADKLGIMMVTNHARDSRAVARGVYVHFLLDYPQTKARWTKQLKFLLKNLEYKHPEGRQSIMEALNTLLSKIDDEMAQEIISSFFVPIVLRMENDENKECQEMAEALLGQLFRKADSAQTKTLLEPLRAWAEQTDNAALTKLGMHAFGVFFEASKGDVGNDLTQLRSSIEKTLAAHNSEDESDWEPIYQALQLLSKVVVADPGAVMSRKQAGLWSSICALQSHRQPLIQTIVASLIGVRFHDLAKTNAEPGFNKLPLLGEFGLALGGDAMLDLMRSFLRLIKRNESHDDCLWQVVRNLLFIGRCICVNDLTVQIRDTSRDREVEEKDSDNEMDDLSDGGGRSKEGHTKDIPAVHYLLHQCASILRYEPPKSTTASLHPKKTILQLLTSLLPHFPTTLLPQPIVHTLLLPLTHLIDPHITAPRSADPAFAPAYTELTEAAHAAMEQIQKKVGDTVYVNAMTGVARAVRERRQERKVKRVIERVAEPERAARKKRRLGERKVERKRELVGAFRKGRRGA